MSCPGSRIDIPTLAVASMDNPFTVPAAVANAERSRSATNHAPSWDAAGNRTANSSPPSRPTRSDGLRLALAVFAKIRRISSPAAWPN